MYVLCQIRFIDKIMDVFTSNKCKNIGNNYPVYSVLKLIHFLNESMKMNV